MDTNMKDSGRKTSFARKEMGASVIGVLVPGVTGFLTPNEVMEKALNEHQGKVATDDLANNPKVIAGKYLEPVITKLFIDELIRNYSLPLSAFQISVPDRADFYKLNNGFIGSSLDNLLTIDGVLELTDHNNFTYPLNNSGPLEIKNYSGAASDPVSMQYQYQVQAQILCTGSEWGILARLVKGWEFQYFIYQRNQEMIDEMIDAATDFWDRFDGILEGKDYWYPPATTKEASKIYRGNQSKEVVDMSTNNELSQLIDDYMKANEAAKLAEADKDEASKAIKSIIKEHELVSYNGYMISHTSTKRKKTKMVEVPGAEPIVSRRFSIKNV